MSALATAVLAIGSLASALVALSGVLYAVAYTALVFDRRLSGRPRRGRAPHSLALELVPTLVSLAIVAVFVVLTARFDRQMGDESGVHIGSAYQGGMRG